MRSFTLKFEDASGASLGGTGTLTAVSQFAPQTYSFASTVNGAKTVHMDVLTSRIQIEIREVAFNGTVSAVPEPASAVLLMAGLAGLGALRRRRSTAMPRTKKGLANPSSRRVFALPDSRARTRRSGLWPPQRSQRAAASSSP